ncbi:MAG: class I SAM-dependent methyltransferase [Chloroflexi bacterium]|nr:MAG: class I SAM-dependent methyltransferase [Chloroflexota bacterium]
MSQSARVQLFDAWAGNYDAEFTSPDGAFPFDRYDQVLDEAARQAAAAPQMRVLDLGVGTGNLAARLARQGCAVWGVDFSAEMLARAQAKLPGARLLQADLLGDWPAELDRPFDRVVSAYVFHEFDLPAKIGLLRRIASRHLSAGGRIVVADIAYPTVAARAEAARRLAGAWDEDEFYWAADEALAAAQEAGLTGVYKQVSSCGGVLAFTLRLPAR